MPEDSIKNFLQYVFGMVEGIEVISQAKSDDFKICRTCGTSFGGFKVSGKLGCAKCYDAFREPIVQALSNIHGASLHKGKVLHGTDGLYADVLARRELDDARLQLALAVEDERYEEAAKLRDLITELGKKVENKIEIETGGGENA